MVCVVVGGVWWGKVSVYVVEEVGTTVMREWERFVEELCVVFATGETGTLE